MIRAISTLLSPFGSKKNGGSKDRKRPSSDGRKRSSSRDSLTKKDSNRNSKGKSKHMYWSLEGVDLETALKLFFTKVDPIRVALIPSIMEQFVGDEILLLQELCRKYSQTEADMQQFLDKAVRTRKSTAVPRASTQSTHLEAETEKPHNSRNYHDEEDEDDEDDEDDDELDLLDNSRFNRAAAAHNLPSSSHSLPNRHGLKHEHRSGSGHKHKHLDSDRHSHGGKSPQSHGSRESSPARSRGRDNQSSPRGSLSRQAKTDVSANAIATAAKERSRSTTPDRSTHSKSHRHKHNHRHIERTSPAHSPDSPSDAYSSDDLDDLDDPPINASRSPAASRPKSVSHRQESEKDTFSVQSSDDEHELHLSFLRMERDAALKAAEVLQRENLAARKILEDHKDVLAVAAAVAQGHRRRPDDNSRPLDHSPAPDHHPHHHHHHHQSHTSHRHHQEKEISASPQKGKITEQQNHSHPPSPIHRRERDAKESHGSPSPQKEKTSAEKLREREQRRSSRYGTWEDGTEHRMVPVLLKPEAVHADDDDDEDDEDDDDDLEVSDDDVDEERILYEMEQTRKHRHHHHHHHSSHAKSPVHTHSESHIPEAIRSRSPRRAPSPTTAEPAHHSRQPQKLDDNILQADMTQDHAIFAQQLEAMKAELEQTRIALTRTSEERLEAMRLLEVVSAKSRETFVEDIATALITAQAKGAGGVDDVLERYLETYHATKASSSASPQNADQTALSASSSGSSLQHGKTSGEHPNNDQTSASTREHQQWLQQQQLTQKQAALQISTDERADLLSINRHAHPTLPSHRNGQGTPISSRSPRNNRQIDVSIIRPPESPYPSPSHASSTHGRSSSPYAKAPGLSDKHSTRDYWFRKVSGAGSRSASPSGSPADIPKRAMSTGLSVNGWGSHNLPSPSRSSSRERMQQQHQQQKDRGNHSNKIFETSSSAADIEAQYLLAQRIATYQSAAEEATSALIERNMLATERAKTSALRIASPNMSGKSSGYPNDWVGHWDPKKHRKYYYSKSRGQSVWATMPGPAPPSTASVHYSPTFPLPGLASEPPASSPPPLRSPQPENTNQWESRSPAMTDSQQASQSEYIRTLEELLYQQQMQLGAPLSPGVAATRRGEW